MTRILALFSLGLIVFASGTSPRAAEPVARGARDGLRASFNVQGEIVHVFVRQFEARRYVRDFVAGRAPSILPVSVISELRAALPAAQSSALRDARLVRASECRAGECAPLKGLYAGRSPF